MLRAEAAVFTPQDSFAKCRQTSVEESGELCSTVAPSPALTAADLASPMLSPYWAHEDPYHFADDTAMWTRAVYGGYLPDGCLPELSLPDQFDDNELLQPAYVDEFTLEGLEDLQTSLAGFLSKVGTLQEGESSDSTSAQTVSPPPGLAPPPGLDAPPGLEELETPPGIPSAMTEETVTSNLLSPGTTTAMLRNIPNKYTQNGVVERLHMSGFKGDLDFIYLPIDFKNKCNVGYAFVNFRTAEACARFASEYHHCNSREKLPGYNSKKICEVSEARFQGRAENIRRLQASSVMAELVANPEWLPKLFNENGEEQDFPIVDTSKEMPSRGTRGRQHRRKGTA